MTRQKNIAIVGFSFVILYTIAWFVLANIAEDKIVAQLEAEKAHGIEITTGIRSKSGFPFALAVRLRDFTARTASGLTVEAPVMVMSARLANWSHVTVAAPEGTLLTLPAGRVRGEIKAAITTADGSIDFGANGIGASSLSLNAVTATGLLANAGPLTTKNISVHYDKPETPPADHSQPGCRVIVNVTDTLVPQPTLPGLGNEIKRLTIDAVVLGKPPMLNEASLKAWSDDGGTVDVHELSTQWGPLGLGLGGTVTLDPELQPVGSFNAKITGFNQTLDALSATHAIKPTAAGLLTIGLGLLAKPEGADNVPTLTVPLSVQDNAVYVASFKLASIPPVRLY